jgi:hypothetical protein
MKKLIAVLSVVLAASLSLSADVYIKSTTHQDAMTVMGQTTPAKDSVSEQWIGDDKFANVSPDQSMIIDLKKNMAWIVSHKDKTYVEAPLPLDLSKLLPPEMAAFAGMMKMSATVAPNSETKTIGQWKCQGYTMTMSMMGQPITTKIWASTDVGFDSDAFNSRIMGNLLKGTGMMLDDASIKEFGKIKGFQIASETTGNIMGAAMHSTTEVQEISKKSAPAGIYAVPAGYAKSATLSMDALRK